MRLLGVLIGALALAAPAAADVPAGFVAVPALSTRAAFVAGKPVTVYCAQTLDAWQAFIKQRNTDDAAPADPGGLTDPAAGATYLHPAVCNALAARLVHPRHYDLLRFSAGLLVLTHEAEHLRGVADEGTAECDAVHEAPTFARHSFGFTSRKTLRTLTADVLYSHRTLPPVPYQSVC